MSFYAAIHPFQLSSRYPEPSGFFAPIEMRKSLLTSIRNQMRVERGNILVSSESGNQCMVHYKISRHNFLVELQEYAVNLDHGSSEAIYMGTEQTRFNHLVEIRNNPGIYLPIFFLFPTQISIPQQKFPVFVGSADKLQIELAEIDKELRARERVDIGDVQLYFEASEEDMEDYEASHEGTEHFWPSFQFIILDNLIKNCIQYKLPLFIF